jgi:hypothetical protein
VTSWALFGAVDWNSLLTRESGFYEPGAFDIRNSPPRLTVIGRAVQSLAQNGKFDHPGSGAAWLVETSRAVLSTDTKNDGPALCALPALAPDRGR